MALQRQLTLGQLLPLPLFLPLLLVMRVVNELVLWLPMPLMAPEQTLYMDMVLDMLEQRKKLLDLLEQLDQGKRLGALLLGLLLNPDPGSGACFLCFRYRKEKPISLRLL